ncbi:MAG: DUF2157 domain-containing protein [Planctomycetia bacterium]|nr:DUF2157 domain-containing protein [Planctomycetia bacterium]
MMDSPKQISTIFFRFLSQELDFWTAEKIIEPERRERILAQYEPVESADFMYRIGMTILLSLSAVLIALAALLMAQYYWEIIPLAGQFGIIFGGCALSYVGARALKCKNHPVLAEVALFLGCLFFGALVVFFLLALDVPWRAGEAFFLWTCSVFLIALGTRTPILHALAAVSLIVWSAVEVKEYGASLFMLIPCGENRLFIPHAAWSAPLMALIGCICASFLERRNIVRELVRACYLLVLVVWLLIFPMNIRGAEGISFYLISAGGALYIFSQTGGRSLATKLVLGISGALIMGGALLVFSFYDAWSLISTPKYGRGLLAQWSLIGTAAFYLFWFVDCEIRNDSSSFRRLAFPLLIVLYGAAAGLLREQVIWMYQDAESVSRSYLSYLSTNTAQNPWIPITLTTIQNVAIFCLCVYFIRLGMTSRRFLPFIGGAGYFVIWIFVRYCDLFGDFGGSLGAALLFLVSALLLFGLSFWFYRTRNRKPLGNETSPKWSIGALFEVSRTAFPFCSKRLVPAFLVLGLALQAVLFGVLAYDYFLPRKHGVEIVLKTEAYFEDGRNFVFPGRNSGKLRYDFSYPRTINHPKNWIDRRAGSGRNIYATLKQEPGTTRWTLEQISFERPEGNVVYLAGIQEGNYRRFGVEKAELQHETIKSLRYSYSGEITSPFKEVEVTLLVSPNGRACLKDCRVLDEKQEEVDFGF